MRQKPNRNMEDFAKNFTLCTIFQIYNIRTYILSSYHFMLHYINSTFVSFDRCCTAIILLAEEDTSSIADVCI